MGNPAFHRPAFIPAVVYKDNRAALKWLQKAFGFEPSEVLTDGDDNIVHAEMTHEDAVIMIGNEFTSWARSPSSAGDINTQRVHVRLSKGIDEHCAQARGAGAQIAMEPADQFYGDRTYMAVDPEGHRWTFFQQIKNVSLTDMENATGFKFKPL
jgi:uncharacterized glyoxalase superfamily protein PhnB